MKPLKVGLLPLYLELYDRSFGRVRTRIDTFHRDIAAALTKRGLEVVTAPVCRLQPEFTAAIRDFEKAGVDALVTLHLAYSPSLESSAALAATALPVIVLDTTPTYDFGPAQSPDEIMYNHGIHGVQDMCNLLLRNGKPFRIEAGHWQKSDVIDRVAGLVRAARAASAQRRQRVGCIGAPFKGMGDFAVPSAVLKQTLGVTAVVWDFKTGAARMRSVGAAALKAEVEAYRAEFKADGIAQGVMERTARVSLGIRQWLEQEALTAFTMNFLAVNRRSGLPTVPFLEASRAMARGLGYAGEGDVLTASLVGALAAAYPATTFTEMFCPDWKGNRVFLSHMGEINVRILAARRPRLVEMDYTFSEADNPARVVGCMKGGPAVFINLAPLAGRRYRLIVAPVTMESVKGTDRMTHNVHGWFTPAGKVGDFLAAYSRAGGTHHAALVYGQVAQEIAAFGEFMGWDVSVLP
jgi:L-arabinose isomerase